MTRFTEAIEEESISKVCAECVRGVLISVLTCRRKTFAASGVHWLICMHWSQTLMTKSLPDVVVPSHFACDIYKL